MKFYVMCCLMLATRLSLAAPKIPVTSNLSLREKAQIESENLGKLSHSATDAQVSGMLNLKDPRPEVITRLWLYFATLSGQKIQPFGKATKAETATFDLSQNGPTLMPSLSFGVLSKPQSLKTGNWSLGVLGKSSFSSQSAPQQLPSGFRVEDARLNTSILTVGPLVHLQLKQNSRWGFTFSPQIGNLNYTQTSANELAAFSKQATLYSFSYGAFYLIKNDLSLFAEYSRRYLSGLNEFEVQKNAIEVGTKVTW